MALPTEVYTQAEVEQLIQMCGKRGPTGLRNRALLALLYSTGLRIAEALALRLHDLEAGGVHVRRGKGSKPRRSAMFRFAEPHLRAWIAAREQLGVGDLAPLFCTLQGKEVGQAYVRHLLRRLGKKAGIAKRMHPHAFRHSHTAALLEGGAQFLDVSRQLGHARPSTTDTYTRRIPCPDLVERIREIA
jgi:integrase/recombinase XerD